MSNSFLAADLIHRVQSLEESSNAPDLPTAGSYLVGGEEDLTKGCKTTTRADVAERLIRAARKTGGPPLESS